jgi:uncharacterized protein with PIN domain
MEKLVMTKGTRPAERGHCPGCGQDLSALPEGMVKPTPKPHLQDGTLRFNCPACKARLVETRRFDLWLASAWDKDKKRTSDGTGNPDAGEPAGADRVNAAA